VSGPESPNRIELGGRIVELGALRHTPAGLPVAEFRILHESIAIEAGQERRVNAEVDAIAFDAQARLIASAPLDSRLRVEGFLCARSQRSRKLVLHVSKVEFIESSESADADGRNLKGA
jgi:primosomal replication protein N